MDSIMAFCGICLFLTAQLHFDLLVPIFHLVFEMHNGFFWILCLSSNVSIIAAFYQHIFLGQMKSQCPVAPSQGKAQYSTLVKEDKRTGKTPVYLYVQRWCRYSTKLCKSWKATRGPAHSPEKGKRKGKKRKEKKRNIGRDAHFLDVGGACTVGFSEFVGGESSATLASQ